MRYLILGSGPAGIAAAKAARKTDKDAEVLIATEEYAAPYLAPCSPTSSPASGNCRPSPTPRERASRNPG